LLDNKKISSNSIKFKDCVLSKYNSVVEKTSSFFKRNITVPDISSIITALGIESFQISLLSILFFMAGLILFLYGLIGGHIYQYIMAFFFLAPGFILEDLKKEYLSRK
jgi:hypothetical protein